MMAHHEKRQITLKVMELSQDHNVIDIGKKYCPDLHAYLVLAFACLKKAKR